MSIEFLTCAQHIEMLRDLLIECLRAVENKDDAVCAVDAFMDKLNDKENDDVPGFLWSVTIKLMNLVKKQHDWTKVTRQLQVCICWCSDELRFLETIDIQLKETDNFRETKEDVMNEVTKATCKYVCVRVWSELD